MSDGIKHDMVGGFQRERQLTGSLRVEKIKAGTQFLSSFISDGGGLVKSMFF